MLTCLLTNPCCSRLRFSEVQIDTGHSGVIPTINIQDADTGAEVGGVDSAADTPTPPGGMPTGPAPAIPDWYKVGWRQMSGIDAAPLPEGEEKDKGVLDMFLSEQFYGSWYHNAALIVFVGAQPSFVAKPFKNNSLGCVHLALPHPFWFWLGMAIHTSSCVQHVLQYIHGTCSSRCP